ncbi:hypothetical protein A2125_02775 [Candidatus Woesebacteria bacterium GWB1_43_5]|uniref:Thymidylate kinase-like domain-containing protein n=1 Tax=Candidatus Woesebacteria bacterium GWB1_43_5 TaxID=1802474 RepID=A0A1F7WSS1_9BACT|nr:MAG: hypothetical protein A2125_02775 [Candidatus Woesebacteria bacterium GWB1_43_5]
MAETGKFITLYGINRTGKSTQAARLGQSLEGRGLKVKVIKYPIYQMEPTGPRIDAVLRRGLPMSDLALQREFAQNRRDFEVVIKDGYLKNGIWVVAEDYAGTGIAWGVTRGIPLQQMEEMNADLLKENLAILLDGVPFSTGVERGHRYEDNSEDMEKARGIHLDLVERYGWEIVNCNQTEQEVANDIWRVVEKKFFT